MKRRVIVALSTAGLVSAGAVVYVLGGDSLTASAGSAPRPGPGEVHTVALRDMSGAQGTAGAQHQVMGLPAERTKPFSMLGVSWTDPRAVIDGTVQVRTRSAAGGTWTPWQPVEAHNEDGPGDDARSESRVRGATAPLWVGPSNGVQVRVAGKGRALPAGLRVELIDPGDGAAKPKPRAIGPGTAVLAGAVSTEPPAADPSTDPTAGPTETATEPSAPADPASPADGAPPADPAPPSEDPTGSPSPTSSASPESGTSAGVTAASSTAPQPTVVTRAQWGADESLVKEPAEYAPSVKVVFTHHTAGTNNYTCAESPAIVRSLLLYHVKTNGWNDLGYNFLVDKCGTIFEGRKGGIDKPLIGAHTYGFNTGSSGISVLGDYTKTAPAQPALSAVARVAAWKLGLHGGDPTGKASMTTTINNGKFPAGETVSFNTVSGHRDGYATECPGQLLYDKLPAIRTEAKQWATPVTSVALTSTAGATKVGTTYYTKGTVTLGWKPAAVSGYEVLVGHTVVARPGGTSTSAKITLSAGSHDVRLRATNINGTTATSPAYRMTVDTTAPVFTTPAGLGVNTGTVTLGGSIPVKLGWKATDNTVLQSIRATSPTAATFSPTTTNWKSSAKSNASTVWSLTAADAAGNTRVSAVTRTGSLIHESGSRRTGTWKATSGSSYVGGRAYYSTARNASAAYTFTGRSVGLIVRRSTNYGAFYVYVDGVKTAYVDTRYSKSYYRQVVWTKTWSTSAKHTIKIVVAGTSGRPTVVTDGIAYIK
ncbi:N-acetylmuramoyl-L-alanine amidase [Actinomadura sp. NPDC047616]|uniref:N-acetylmuramoyl-L-alanine amidase n=1 Tax=Actinomadura sp. NPDC047616 TaxID=3155914 RepID=UPI0033E0546E